MTDRRSFLTAAGLAAVAAGAGLGAAGCSTPPRGRAAVPVRVPIAQVPVGGGKILTEGRYVITQPTAGTFRAFDKDCPHQGCPVTKIQDAEIVCVCHNSRFTLADGRVTTGPSTSGLTPATATVEGDEVVITAS